MIIRTHVLIDRCECEDGGGRDLGVVVAESALQVLGGVVHARADLAEPGNHYYVKRPCNNKTFHIFPTTPSSLKLCKACIMSIRQLI